MNSFPLQWAAAEGVADSEAASVVEEVMADSTAVDIGITAAAWHGAAEEE